MHVIKGGASAIYLKICDLFWAPVDHNFERTGIFVRGKLLKFRYGFMLVDEKAEKEILGIKGASGMRMCVSCLNCVRTNKPIDERSDLVLFSDPDMSKFEKNTPALCSAALDHLADQKRVLGKTAFKKLETMLGLSYSSCVVLYSSYRAMLNIPTARYTDWFHDLLASGGVFQIMVNEVVLDILETTPLTLNDIDKFQADVCLPEAKLGKTFFEDRIVQRRGCHVRAFGSETISAVIALCFLFACVFDGSARFAQHARLCELARECLEILLAGDIAVGLADRLDDAFEELQTILLLLYPWCAVPKLHLMRHIKDALEKHRVNMSCCGAERLHRKTKEFGRFAFRNFQDTILVRTIKTFLDALEDDRSFLHTEFEGKARPLMVFGVSTASWKSVRVGHMRVRAGNVVHWSRASRFLGRVRGIVQCEGIAFAAVVMLSVEADGSFSCGALERLVECSALDGVLAYIALGPDAIKVLMPLL